MSAGLFISSRLRAEGRAYPRVRGCGVGGVTVLHSPCQTAAHSLPSARFSGLPALVHPAKGPVATPGGSGLNTGSLARSKPAAGLLGHCGLGDLEEATVGSSRRNLRFVAENELWTLVCERLHSPDSRHGSHAELRQGCSQRPGSSRRPLADTDTTSDGAQLHVATTGT